MSKDVSLEVLEKEIVEVNERLLRNESRENGAHCAELERLRHLRIAEDINLLEELEKQKAIKLLPSTNPLR